MKWLRQKVIGSRVQATNDVVGPRARSEQNHVDIATPMTLANLTAQIDPAHFRHLPIRYDQMKLTRAHQFKRFATIGSGGHVVTELPKIFDEDFASYVIIVNNEHTHYSSPQFRSAGRSRGVQMFSKVSSSVDRSL